MSSTVWFGTENQMRWIAAPQPGVVRSIATANAAKQLLNGGAWRRSSATGSRQLQLVWPTMTGAEVRKITAFLEGTYGPGPFYYVDPFAENANLLPQWLAVPYLATDGGPKLADVAVTKVTTPANTYLHPTFGASYAVGGTGNLKE